MDYKEKSVLDNHAVTALMAVAVVYLLFRFYLVLLFGEWHYFDDLLTIDQIRDLSYKDIFSSTLIGTYYYRPIILALTKLAYTCFGESAIMLRFGQVVLHLSSVIIFAKICRSLKLHNFALMTGVLCLAFSSHTFLRISYYSIGIGTYVVSFLFLLALLLVVTNRVSIPAAITISLLGILTREQALVIPFVFFLYYLLDRKYLPSLYMVVLVAVYMAFRMFVMGQSSPPLYHCSSGWFTSFYEIPVLEEKFGTTPYLFYLYNVITHIIGLFIYLPWKGQFIIPDQQTWILILVYLMTGCVVAAAVWKGNYTKIQIRHTLILILGAVIITNALIAYNYSRHRMMFLGGISFSVLFAIGLGYIKVNYRGLLSQLLLIAVFSGWCGFGYYSIKFITTKLYKIDRYYLSSSVPKPGVEQHTHDMMRNKLLREQKKQNN